MSATQVLERSRRFLREQGLRRLADALPDRTNVRVEDTPTDFDRAFAFPPTGLMMQHLDEMVDRLARAPLDGIPDDQQYRGLFYPELDALVNENRGDGPYILRYRSAGVLDETRSRTMTATKRLFERNAWTSLTLPEYLVLQRWELLRTGDHRFDDYTSDPAQWMVLADTRCAVGYVGAFWYAKKQEIQVYTCKAGSKNLRRGAHRTMVAPLG